MNPLAQRTMFEMFEEPDSSPICKHPVELETVTTWPGEEWERLTWTCEKCGNVRGRITVGVKPLTYEQWMKRQGRSV